jgi:N-acetylglucosaminyldiphosphoundecaprenol N-acetyl-beta-D-mannosaminyltransferase
MLTSGSVAAFLDIHIHALTRGELTELVAKRISENQKVLIANHNLHSLYLFHKQPYLREFYAKADVVHADGMALVVLSMLYKQGLRREHRTTYVDWMDDLMATTTVRQWKVFYLGSAPGVAGLGAERLRERYPGLQIRTRHGYFDAEQGKAASEEILADVRQYSPDILMVGMGMPRQERWILDNFDAIEARIILPSGAAMDYVAGVVPTPPRWAGKLCMEWIFRLAAEPRRLASRYFSEPISILRLMAMDGIKRMEPKPEA